MSAQDARGPEDEEAGLEARGPASSGLTAAAGCIFRDLGLIVRGRVVVGWHRTAGLQEGHAAKPGLGVAALFAVARGAIALAIAVAVCLMRLAGLILPLLSRLAFLAGFAPTLVVALAEATHALDHAEIVVGILPVGFRHDAIAGRSRLSRQRLVLVKDLVGVATDPHVGPAAVEDLVAVRRTVGIVMLLVMMAATTAATIATAARPLTIV